MLASKARLTEDNDNLLLTLLSGNGSSMCAKITLDLADKLSEQLAEMARQTRSVRDGQVSDEAA